MNSNQEFENPAKSSDSKQPKKPLEAIQISIADLELPEVTIESQEESELLESTLSKASSAPPKSVLQLEDERKAQEEMKEILEEVYAALCEKGYDPARQIAGYILSEDPVYITNWKNARGLVTHINRDDLLTELIRHYFKNFEHQ